MILPTSWRDLSIEQYLKIGGILKSKLDVFDKKMLTLSIATGKEEEELQKLDGKILRYCFHKLKFIEDMNIKVRVPEEFKIGRRRFKVNLNIAGYTAGQYISIKTFAQEGVDGMHKVLAVICHEVKRKFFFFDYIYEFDASNHKQISDILLKGMSIADAYPVFVFFCELWGALKDPMLTYTKKEARKTLVKLMNLKKEKHSKNTGDGS